MQKPDSGGAALATTHDDIKGILGDIDPTETLAIKEKPPRAC